MLQHGYRERNIRLWEHLRASSHSEVLALRDHMRGLPGYKLPSLEALRDLALTMARMVNPDCKVVGISVNTAAMSAADARAYLADVEAKMGLPAVDPFRDGAERLVDALEG